MSDWLNIWLSKSLHLWLPDYLTVWLSDCLTVWLSDCLTLELVDFVIVSIVRVVPLNFCISLVPVSLFPTGSPDARVAWSTGLSGLPCCYHLPSQAPTPETVCCRNDKYISTVEEGSPSYYNALMRLQILNVTGTSLQIDCSTVQYSTVQYSTVQYSTVQYSTVQYSTVRIRIRIDEKPETRLLNSGGEWHLAHIPRLNPSHWDVITVENIIWSAPLWRSTSNSMNTVTDWPKLIQILPSW